MAIDNNNDNANSTELQQEQDAQDDQNIIYPTGLKLALVMGSIFVGMFLISLDRLIVSTAIPQITDEFHSTSDIGWYATAYLLTSCAFQLVFGKIYAYFSIKATFLASIAFFEVGSALCGAAPSSVSFIIGRALAGLGSGGVQAGCLVVIVYAVPLAKRPKYQGFFGAVFGISSICGPLIGGAFTTNVTWRWCFYMNLPIGGAVMLLIFFLLHIPDRPETKIPLKDKLRQLNALGLLTLLPGVVCLCLALQWGGTTYAWSEGRIVALLTLAFALLIAFALIQVWKPDQATLPPRIFIQRSIFAGFWVSACLGAHLNIFVYYLPIWFQAIDGVSAITSGIHLLPMLLSVVLGGIFTGLIVGRVGYYTPFLILGVCLSSIGAGLLTTLQVDTGKGKWIGFQILYGIGFGASAQAPNLAAQTVLSLKDVPIGASLMFFGLQLFGAIFTSVSLNVLDNQLVKRLAGIPGVSAKLIESLGATNFLNVIPAQYHAAALVAYNNSLRVVFRIGLIVACLALLGALAMEWRTVKGENPPIKPDGERAAEEGKGDGNSSVEAPKEKVEADSEGEAHNST